MASHKIVPFGSQVWMKLVFWRHAFTEGEMFRKDWYICAIVTFVYTSPHTHPPKLTRYTHFHRSGTYTFKFMKDKHFDYNHFCLFFFSLLLIHLYIQLLLSLLPFTWPFLSHTEYEHTPLTDLQALGNSLFYPVFICLIQSGSAQPSEVSCLHLLYGMAVEWGWPLSAFNALVNSSFLFFSSLFWLFKPERMKRTWRASSTVQLLCGKQNIPLWDHCNEVIQINYHEAEST